MVIELHKLILGCILCFGYVHGQNLIKQTSPDRVYGDTIYIFPREVLYFKAKIKGDFITSIQEIKPTEDSTNCLIISLDEKNIEDLADVFSKLTVYNPYGKKLHYKASVKYRKNSNSFVTEFALPVPANKHFFSLWADQAAVVKVYDLRLENIAGK